MSKRLSNKEIIQELKEVLAAMEVKDNNRFVIRAYQNAVASIEGLTISVYDLWEGGRLGEITGVGSSLKQHFEELFKEGKVEEWARKKEGLPEGMFELLVLRGVGAKTAFKLSKAFNIKTREEAFERVKKAAQAHEIQKLPRFGEKSEAEILKSLEEQKKSKQEKERLLLSRAEEVVGRISEHLKKSDFVIEYRALGSYRRRNSTVADIDFAVSSENPEGVIDHFVTFPEIKTIETQGDRMSTVILGNDIQVDILVVKPEALGSLLQHFTGSKQHNIKLRTYALGKGMSLSQYGIKQKGVLQEFASEEKFYEYLGLEWIPPEIREGKNEIELARRNKLPKLINLSDIKGDLHWHTTASDGVDSLGKMVDRAVSLGYEYVGVCDHSPSIQSRGRYEVLGIVGSMRMKVDAINESRDDIKVLYGYEVSILADSSLALPDDILEKLDFVIGSIHTSFKQSRKEITERLITAIKNPHVSIIGHPTGRLINEREPLDLDWVKVFKAIKENDKILEINGQPDRLDLPAHLVQDALKAGIKFIINTDAHSAVTMDHMRYGIDVARRGWCEKKDIINTLNYSNIKDLL